MFLPAAFGRLTIGDGPANALFQEAIAENRHHGVVRSIPVQRTEERPTAILHVVPLRRAALDVFSGADILVADGADTDRDGALGQCADQPVRPDAGRSAAGD